MSDFLKSLVQRSAGAAEPDTIQPQQNPWIRINADGEELSWGSDILYTHPPDSDEFVSVPAETDMNRDPFPDNQGQSANEDPVQSNQDNMHTPITPDSQNDAHRSTNAKDDQGAKPAEQPNRREINPSQPEVDPWDKMTRNKTDLHLRDEEKPKSEPTESHIVERKEKEYLEKVVERVTEARSEIQRTVQNTHIEIASGKDADIQQKSPRKPAFETALRMIQPQSGTPNRVDIRPRKKTEPEVVIENLTVEVVQEKKVQPVKKVQLPAPGQKESKTPSTNTRKVTGTKLRFGLGQM